MRTLTGEDVNESAKRKRKLEGKTKAALLGFGQVLFVSMTTVAIVKHAYAANFFLALMVNIFWVFNVKTATQGNKWEKIAYALGASSGSVIGAILGTHLL